MIYWKKLLATICVFSITHLLIIANENEDYINRELSNLDKFLIKCNFVDGEIFFQNDTIHTKILLHKKRDQQNYYLFCITKSSNDSIIVYTAEKILGYRIMDDIYIKYGPANKPFFIKRIKSGKVNLYKREEIPSDNRLLYFMVKYNSSNFYIINPFENNIKEYKMPNTRSGNSHATISYLEDQGVDKKFKFFITMYMWDCERAKNMVKSDYYTISSIPSIVETYNNCFKPD